MKVEISEQVYHRIGEFYDNVAKSYTSLNVKDVAKKVRVELYKVGTSLQSTTISLPKWREKGLKVCFSRTTKWYFAYRVEGDTIFVEGAEYGKNMANTSFIANSDRETDGNYNPQKQFISDHKRRRPITLIISERQLPILKAALIEEYSQKKMIS